MYSICLQANEKDIIGLTREEAVTYLTSLEGMVTLTVQYKKEGELLPPFFKFYKSYKC